MRNLQATLAHGLRRGDVLFFDGREVVLDFVGWREVGGIYHWVLEGKGLPFGYLCVDPRQELPARKQAP